MKTILILSLFFSISLFGSDHGIYLLTNKSVKVNIDSLTNNIIKVIEENNFSVLNSLTIHTPDHVREDSTEHCGYRSRLIVLTSTEYTDMITSFNPKYLVAGFLKIGLYETPMGVNVCITDPETINRIIFNDMYENDDEKSYNHVIEKTTNYKKVLIDILHNSVAGEKVEEIMEPIRDDEDLAESSRDMFMMVGPLTLFNDEDQFPVIYSTQNIDGFKGLKNLKNKFSKNLESFVPEEDDVEYRWFQNKNDLKWNIVAEIQLPEKNAILLGLTRPRTEAVSFNIAGSSRENDDNMCPGIDHVGAYPIEVLIIQEENNINVYTQREMHRMDMYFWDAGMAAFMDHMSMPGILDDSIKKALLGNKINEE